MNISYLTPLLLLYAACALLLPLITLGALWLLKGKPRHSSCYLVLILCTVRILIPTGYGLPTLFDVTELRQPAATEAPIPTEDPILPPTDSDTQLPADPEPTPPPTVQPSPSLPADTPLTPSVDESESPSLLEQIRENLTVICLAIWGAGTLFMLAWHLLFRQYRLNRAEKRLRLPPDDSTQQCYQVLCRDLRIRRPPSLYKLDAPVVPHLNGLVRPCIYLGDTALTRDELSYILHHELIHFRRRDIVIKLLSFVSVALFWWNPAVWLLNKRLNEELELSCDERLLAEKGADSRGAYGDALLKVLLQTRKDGPRTGLGLFSAKHITVTRFREIAGGLRKRRGTALLVMFCAFFLGSSLLLGCNGVSTAHTDVTDGSHTQEQPADGVLTDQTADGDLTDQTADSTDEDSTSEDASKDDDAATDPTQTFFLHGEQTLSREQLLDIAAKLDIPHREGMHMIGWNVYSEKQEDGNYALRLEPAFAPNAYRLSLVANGGTVNEKDSYLYGDALPQATRAGYTFGGWYADKELTQPLTAVPAESMTIYARWTEETATSCFTFTERGNTLTLTAYTGTDTAVTVPAYVGGKPVTSVAANAFAFQTVLESLTLPGTVTQLGAGAFRYCYALQRLTLGAAPLSVDRTTFEACYRLAYVTLPETSAAADALEAVLPATAALLYAKEQ